MDAEARGRQLDLSLRKRPRHEVVVFGKLMAALSTMKARDLLAEFQVEIYEDATVDVPLTVLIQTVRRLMQTPDQWRPDSGTLLGECEKTRLELRSSMAYKPCPICAETSTPGWITVRTPDDVQRLQRCACWTSHQERVKELGAGDKPLAMLTLPAGVE